MRVKGLPGSKPQMPAYLARHDKAGARRGVPVSSSGPQEKRQRLACGIQSSQIYQSSKSLRVKERRVQRFKEYSQGERKHKELGEGSLPDSQLLFSPFSDLNISVWAAGDPTLLLGGRHEEQQERDSTVTEPISQQQQTLLRTSS